MMDESSGYSMIRIRDPAGSVEEGRYEFDHGEASITRLSSGTYMAMVTNRRCLLSSLINRLGCFLLSAVPRTDTLIEWTLVGPTKARLQQLFAEMRANGYVFEIESSTPAADFASLTPKQEEHFEKAMDLGYYDIPKRIGLDELSKVLGCSKSTLNVSLRSAERSIFEFYRIMRFGSRLSDRCGRGIRTCSQYRLYCLPADVIPVVRFFRFTEEKDWNDHR